MRPQYAQLGYEPITGTDSKIRGCSSAESLAKALIVLSEVTRGSLTSFTILGGADAGWLAAFAEWFFELSVRIVFGATGEVLYSSLAVEQNVQILIVYDSNTTVDESRVLTTGKT